jgi:hypothetical protein
MQTQHMVTENGGEVLFVAADVASEASAKNMVKAALKCYGRCCCRGCRASRSTSERRRKGGFQKTATLHGESNLGSDCAYVSIPALLHRHVPI